VASRGRETAAKKPRNKRSQVHTTNGTRARGAAVGGFGMSFPSAYGPCDEMPGASPATSSTPYGMNELRGLSWNTGGGPEP